MEDSIIMKVHGKGIEGVLALCDRELIGRELEDGEIRFKVTEGFYGGDPALPDAILRIASMVGSINAVGKKSVDLLVENRLADPDQIRMIAGIPHIQIYNMFS